MSIPIYIYLFMYVYICMYLCVYMYMDVHMHIHYVYVYADANVWICICSYYEQAQLWTSMRDVWYRSICGCILFIFSGCYWYKLVGTQIYYIPSGYEKRFAMENHHSE